MTTKQQRFIKKRMSIFSHRLKRIIKTRKFKQQVALVKTVNKFSVHKKVAVVFSVRRNKFTAILPNMNEAQIQDAMSRGKYE